MPIEKTGSPRVVLDTNVYVSAFTHFRGVPFRLWESAVRRRLLVVSPHIIEEMAGVLRQTFHWSEEHIVRQCKLVVRASYLVRPRNIVQVLHGVDEADNRILECALEGKADLIVSGDRDLLRLKVFQGIPILRPVDAGRLESFHKLRREAERVSGVLTEKQRWRSIHKSVKQLYKLRGR